MQLQGLKKAEKSEKNGLEILYDVERLKQFTKKLPFELTTAQKRVTNEICRDLRNPHHMRRLLQGDVGSGKTVVLCDCFICDSDCWLSRSVDGPNRNIGATTCGKFIPII